jgi:transcriptional regulator with XRE-family HTH domain
MCDYVDIMIGRQLRRRRRLLGLTQQDLALAVGVSFQQIQKYECAYNRLSVATLWKLACALDVEISYFFAAIPRDLEEAPAPARPRPAAADPVPAEAACGEPAGWFNLAPWRTAASPTGGG